MMTPGQQILVGHHFEKRHRRLIEKANNDIKKSIELSDMQVKLIDIIYCLI